jgi:hypothetical protein
MGRTSCKSIGLEKELPWLKKGWKLHATTFLNFPSQIRREKKRELARKIRAHSFTKRPVSPSSSRL